MLYFEKKILTNGLRVIMAPMENTDIVSLFVLIRTGSRYEKKELNGISHFLEHMVFKGTKNWPRPGQISRELDKIGASHNAFTSNECMGFWVKSSTKHFDLILEIISDLILNPLFKTEEIQKEKRVVIEELKMNEDDPFRKILKLLENILYKEHPLGWDILGTNESIERITRKDIFEYQKRNYLSKNMVVVAAGNFAKEKAFKKIERTFSQIKKGISKPPSLIKVFQKSPQFKIVKKHLDQTHFCLGLRGYDRYDERRYILNLLSDILGGNSSSRLYMEIREKLGLAYYIYSWGTQFLDNGYLAIGAGVAHENLEKTLKKIIEICQNIKEKNITKKELNDVKGFNRGRMALNFETSDEIASFIAHYELFYNKIKQPEEILKKIEKISQNDILKIIRDIFKAQKINLAVIGQQAEKEKLLKKHLTFDNQLSINS